MIKILLKNNVFFFISLLVLIIVSSLLSFKNLSLDLYFNQKYYVYAKALSSFFISNSNILVDGLSTFPIWGYGIVHWLFDSSILNILIFQQVLSFYTIYVLDQFLSKNYKKSLVVWRGMVLLALPYFFFHTQIWPKSICSSLLVIGIIQLIYYLNSQKKSYLIYSGLSFGILCNFRSDYLYFIIIIPFILMVWEFVTQKKIKTISTLIIPLLTLILLIPWGIYTYSRSNQFLLTSTNSGHTLFIGLGQLNNNKWGITPADDDLKMNQILAQKFKHRSFSSTGYEESQYLKKVFFLLIFDSPFEWLKKCFYNVRLVFMDPFYVGNVGDFQKNGISNIKEIRTLENAVYNLDFKSIYKIIKDTSWEFSSFEIFQLIITILTKILGIILFLIFIYSGMYFVFFKRKWFIKSPINLLLSVLVLYQLMILIFVFHMPVYNTSIYLIYLALLTIMLNEKFFNHTINKN